MKRTQIILIVLFSVMPLEAFAQTVITLAPEAIVGGLTCTTSSQGTFSTQPISPLAGVEGSIGGFTGDSNFALNLGIGYENRSFDGIGYVVETYGPSHDIMRENYIDLDASFRYNWFQAGVVIGFPLNWHVTINDVFASSMGWNFSNADMMTTVGLFAAGHITVSEWTSGKLIFIGRLDFDAIEPPLNDNGVPITVGNGVARLGYLPDRSSILTARIGLSYEFSVWSGK